MKRLLLAIAICITAWPKVSAQDIDIPSCRVLYSTGASTTTTGTSAQTLYTYTLPGGTLARDGDYVDITVSGAKANNANAIREELFANSTSLNFETTATANTIYMTRATLTYRNSTTIVHDSQWQRGGNTISARSAAVAEAPTADITISWQATTSVQAGDLTYNRFTVLLCKAP